MSQAIAVDRAGRIVLPREVRRQGSPGPGSRLMLDVVAQRIELTPQPHADPEPVVAAGGNKIYVHALAETFSILTGGRQGRRLRASAADRFIELSVLPFVQTQTLSGKDMLAVLSECESRGVRGGAIYDWRHLAAARKAGAEVLFTLDLREFLSLARPGDPRIEVP